MSTFLFILNFENFSLVGSSPEILVRLKEDDITIRPIAGTRKRGKNEIEDKNLAKDLLSDPKEIAEHLMLLDLGRNDVGRVSVKNSVRVTEKMIIENYSHVMHIVSNVTGKLNKKYHPLDVLAAGFPAGTVTGAPKIRAMEIINEVENVSRSFYAGGVGYFAHDGSMDTCITLRTGLIKNKILYVQSGGGIVADSKQPSEYNEIINKATAISFPTLPFEPAGTGATIMSSFPTDSKNSVSSINSSPLCTVKSIPFSAQSTIYCLYPSL